MKSNKKNKKYKFITGWINCRASDKYGEVYKKEKIIAYISNVYLRKKDMPDIWGNKQKITLKVKQKEGSDEY